MEGPFVERHVGIVAFDVAAPHDVANGSWNVHLADHTLRVEYVERGAVWSVAVAKGAEEQQNCVRGPEP